MQREPTDIRLADHGATDGSGRGSRDAGCYRNIFMHAAVGMARIGLDGGIVEVNHKLCDMLGYEPSDLIGLAAGLLLYPQDMAERMAVANTLTGGGEAQAEIDIRYVRKDGTVLWAHLAASLVLDEQGNPEYYIAVVQEITDRKNAEAALRLSEDRLLHAQIISHTGNWEIDLAAMQMWASEEAFRIYGFPLEWPSLNLKEPQSLVIAEDRPMMDLALKRLLAENAAYDVEFRIHRKSDGALRVIHSRAVADRDGSGKPLKVRGVLQDVTESRLAEANFRIAIQTAMDSFWIHDGNGALLEVNGALCALLGYERDELLAMTIADLEATMNVEEVQQQIRAVHTNGSARFETRLRRKDGAVVDVEVSASRTTLADRSCVFLRDITDRKKKEEDIRYLSYHDVLTGLYNRAFFEEECLRLDTLRQLPLSIVMGDINGLKLTNDIFGHAEGDLLLREIAAILRDCCRKEDIIARMGGDEFCILLPQSDLAIAQSICERIYSACAEHEIESESRSYHPSISLGYATKSRENQPIEAILKDAEDLMYKHKLLERNSIHSSLVASIRATMQEKNHETRDHADRLNQYTQAIGKKLGMGRDQLYELELLSTLHDIGKIGVADHILNSKSPLTGQEWAEIRKHPEVGYRIALSSPELVPIANGILCHHERWDGKGYPKGLAGERIPLLARIIAVADAYDAMVSDRPYRKAMASEAALAEIERNAGSQFDPAIASLFRSVLDDQHAGMEQGQSYAI